MRRGDLVTVAATGDYGKPRPAVIVQTDALPKNHACVVICQLTSELVDVRKCIGRKDCGHIVY
jgi:mRNA interferase MazF